MRNIKVKSWFKKREKAGINELEECACLNCGFRFKGYYCPSCGQSVTEFDKPLGFVFYDFLGNFFSFDSRFFHTFYDLLLKPGFLTVEFFSGKRVKYAPPFRVFIFLSFLLFLLLQILSNKGLTRVLDMSLNRSAVAVSDSTGSSSSDSRKTNHLVFQPDSAKSVDIPIDNSILKSGSLADILSVISEKLDKEIEQTSDAGERKKIIKLERTLRSPDLAVSRILKYFSWTFFALLPVFALLLKLFYIRKRIYYIRHLVFSVHLHSFMFLLLSVVVSIILVFPQQVGLFSSWLLLLFPVYIYLALKRFYGQGYRKTLVKFILLWSVYSIIMLVALIGVLIDALVFG